MNQLERMPEPGNTIVIDKHRLTVVSIEDLRVGQVLIETMTEDEVDEDSENDGDSKD